MESRWQLDFAGRASAKGPRILVLLLALAWFASPGYPQNQPTSNRLAKIQKLSDQKKWDEVVREVESAPSRDAEMDYYYGSALAHLDRWSESRTAFLSGRQLAPRDPRFPIELGGVAFKKKKYAEAARWLRQGLGLSPDDE